VSGRLRSTRGEPAPKYRKLVGVGAFARARHSRGASAGAPFPSFGKDETGEQVARHPVSPGCGALALAGYLTIESEEDAGISQSPTPKVSLPAQAGNPVIADLSGKQGARHMIFGDYWVPRFRGA
jgi:hypothetical protein